MIREILACPLLWSMVLGSIGLWLLLPATVARLRRTAGWLLVAAGIGLLFAYLPLMGDWFAQSLFWFTAAVAIVSAVATISSRSPVYSAVWFGLTLLCTAGLFLMQQAQFLAIATIAVYAGAILVLFLFVLMLAQPEGHTFYDRITWGPAAPLFAVLSAALIIGGMTYKVTHLSGSEVDRESAVARMAADKVQAEGVWNGLSREELLEARNAYWNKLPAADRARLRRQFSAAGINDAGAHMAGFGGELFGPQLVAVEVAGTMLLVALVGALAIVIHGREPRHPHRASTESAGERESSGRGESTAEGDGMAAAGASGASASSRGAHE